MKKKPPVDDLPSYMELVNSIAEFVLPSNRNETTIRLTGNQKKPVAIDPALVEKIKNHMKKHMDKNVKRLKPRLRVVK